MNLNLIYSLLFAYSIEGAFIPWHGVNLAGMDFMVNTSGGLIDGAHPTYPSTAAVDAWLNLNATLFRIPVAWNYLQPYPFPTKSLDKTVMSHLDGLIERITKNGLRKAYAIIDIHNYGRFNGTVVGQDDRHPYPYDLGALWQGLASRYINNPYVMFGLMNEPHDQDAETLRGTMQDVVNAIRNITSTHYILLPGISWQGLSSWTEQSQQALSRVVDPAGKMLFDVHQYFDGQGGNTGNCNKFNSTYLKVFQNFTAAMKSLGTRAILTEFGGSNTTQCRETVEDMLSFLEANPDQYFGWVAWGPGLSPNPLIYLEPRNANVTGSGPSMENIIARHMDDTIVRSVTGRIQVSGVVVVLAASVLITLMWF